MAKYLGVAVEFVVPPRVGERCGRLTGVGGPKNPRKFRGQSLVLGAPPSWGAMRPTYGRRWAQNYQRVPRPGSCLWCPPELGSSAADLASVGRHALSLEPKRARVPQDGPKIVRPY